MGSARTVHMTMRRGERRAGSETVTRHSRYSIPMLHAVPTLRQTLLRNSMPTEILQGLRGGAALGQFYGSGCVSTDFDTAD
jgi:hypothetical protein